MAFTPEILAAGRQASLATRQASSIKNARIARQWLRQWEPDLPKGEARRRLTECEVPKASGRVGPWYDRDVAQLFAPLSATYGPPLQADDQRRLQEDANRFENAVRIGKGLRPLSFDEWRIVETAPRPPFVSGPYAAGQVARYRDAIALLKGHSEGLDELDGEIERPHGADLELWNERLAVELGVRRFHHERLISPLADSALGAAILREYGPPDQAEAQPGGIRQIYEDPQAFENAVYQILFELGKEPGRRRSIEQVSRDIASAIGDQRTVQEMSKVPVRRDDEDDAAHKERKRQHLTTYRHIKKGLEGLQLSSQKLTRELAKRWGSRVEVRESDGQALLGLMVALEIVAVSANHKLDPSRKLLAFITKHDAEHEDTKPMRLPSVVKPAAWEPVDCLTVGNELVHKATPEQLDILATYRPYRVFAAINALQSTAFRINSKMLPVLVAAVIPGTGKEVKEKRRKLAIQIELAERFAGEPEIYFDWFFDFRGRMYPVQHPLNPQADDAGKSLLLFAKGKALGEDGLRRLAIHGANCFGLDKETAEVRLKWITDNTDAIFESARSPLDESAFWRRADEKDRHQFLAFCFEWAEAHELKDPSEYVSHIPVAYDCSCNAYQHFSALCGDPLKQDYYAPVAAALRARVSGRKPVELKGPPKRELTINDMARTAFLKIPAKECRGLVKDAVMTTAYGAKAFSIREKLKKKLAFNHLLTESGTLSYIVASLQAAIADAAPSAMDMMKTIQDAAKRAAAAGRTIRWTSPLGFPVMQNYSDRKHPDQKNETASAPNFVHSLDASHMMFTISECLEAGIEDFAMIHDSYATHAANYGRMVRILMAAFNGLHRNTGADSFGLHERFRNFLDEIRGQRPWPDIDPAPDETGAEIAERMDGVSAKDFFEPVEEGEVDGPLNVNEEEMDPGVF